MTGGNLAVVQAGGPTPVINASLFSVLEAEVGSQRHRKVFGARNGLQGLICGDLIDLGFLTAAQLQRVRHSPGAALGSSRVKPSGPESREILGHLRAKQIHQLLVIGGNGAMHAALAISRFCQQHAYELQVVGIPKTVDNDIPGTDRCPGYASAARYVAQSTADLAMDVRSLPQPISILETMGRNVGWLAAAAVAAKRNAHDAPHLVCIPEVPFVLDEFLGELEAMLCRRSWAIVVVAEGLRDQNGRPAYEDMEPSQMDAAGRPLPGGVGPWLAHTVTRKLRIRCRNEKPGLLGRASILHASGQDKRDAELVGRAAVEALGAGYDQHMVALMPLGDNGETECRLLPLEEVAGPERTIPKEWVRTGNPPTNEQFSAYLKPLLGSLLDYEDLFDHA